MELEDCVVCIDSDRIGTGADQLGRVLMKSFLECLAASPRKPRRMLFLNSAVFLTSEGSEVLAALGDLESAGVEIVSCGTCLDYYNRKETLRVGKVGNMAGTVETLLGAGKVINP